MLAENGFDAEIHNPSNKMCDVADSRRIRTIGNMLDHRQCAVTTPHRPNHRVMFVVYGPMSVGHFVLVDCLIVSETFFFSAGPSYSVERTFSAQWKRVVLTDETIMYICTPAICHWFEVWVALFRLD